MKKILVQQLSSNPFHPKPDSFQVVGFFEKVSENKISEIVYCDQGVTEQNFQKSQVVSPKSLLSNQLLSAQQKIAF